jgi:hypothetical protein
LMRVVSVTSTVYANSVVLVNTVGWQREMVFAACSRYTKPTTRARFPLVNTKGCTVP